MQGKRITSCDFSNGTNSEDTNVSRYREIHIIEILLHSTEVGTHCKRSTAQTKQMTDQHKRPRSLQAVVPSCNLHLLPT